MRHLIGYYIRRTFRGEFPRGVTCFAESHVIYPTREAAEAAMRADRLDSRYDHDVAEAWMVDDAEPAL